MGAFPTNHLVYLQDEDRRHPSARLKTGGPTTFLDVVINLPVPQPIPIFQPHRFRERGSPLTGPPKTCAGQPTLHAARCKTKTSTTSQEAETQQPRVSRPEKLTTSLMLQV